MMGFVASIMVVGVIIVCSAMYPNTEATHEVLNPSQSLAFAFATFTFAFGGHSTFPTIQDEMRTKREFKRVFDWAFALMVLLYLPVCAVGYYAFGSGTMSPILDNLLAVDSLATRIASQIATVAITLHLWFVIPLLMNPVVLTTERSVNERLARGMGLSVEDAEDDYGFGIPQRTQLLVRVVNRLLMCMITTGIAIALPSFGNFMAFIGATSVACTVFVLPCVFYMKIFWHRIGTLELIWICMVLLTACFASAVGVYSAILGFMASFGDKTKPPSWILIVVVVGAMVASIVGVAWCVLGVRRSHRKVPVSGSRR
jgi:amino acid permease